MADQKQDASETTKDEPDYKALYEQLKSDSRKWEERAKANRDKAARVDDLEGEVQRLREGFESMRAENESMRAEKERRALVASVAAATGLSEAIVASLSGADEESLTEQATSIANLMPKGAPTAPEAGQFPRDAAKSKTAAQLFGEAVDSILG